MDDAARIERALVAFKWSLARQMEQCDGRFRVAAEVLCRESYRSVLTAVLMDAIAAADLVELTRLQADVRSLARSYLAILQTKEYAKDLGRADDAVKEIERIGGGQPGELFQYSKY